MKILESERLTYWSFCKEDYQQLLALETDLNATKFYGPTPTPEIVENILKSFIGSFKSEKFSYFKVHLKKNEQFIGIGGFERHKYTNEVGIGYLLYKEYWQDNYPYEILSSLLNWGKWIEVDHFISVVLKEDKITQQALRESGMRFFKEEKFDDLLCFYYRYDNQNENELLGKNYIEEGNNLSDK